MISEIIVRKIILGGIWMNYRMNYFTEFPLYVDMLWLVYIFGEKNFFLKTWFENIVKWKPNKQINNKFSL